MTEETTIIITNKRAHYEYFVVERLEVGIVLRGTEVKSVRGRKVNFQDSYATIEAEELILYKFHISPFEKGNIHNHDPLRPRKLLAKKKEIRKLSQKVHEKGFTLIPLQVYFAGRYLKIELGVCKGKHARDKRESVKERETSREIQRHIRHDT